MKTTAYLSAVLLLAAGCAVQPAAFAPEGDGEPTSDAAPPTTPGADGDGGRTVDSAPQVSGDGGKVDALAPEAATPEASTPPAPDAGPSGPDALPPTVDGGADSRPATDAREAGQNQDAGTDSPAPIDAGSDAAPDAVPGDAGTAVEPVCTSTLPACKQATDADDAVRATFTKPCTPEGLVKCGGVYRGVVETLPIICRQGIWRLDGYWSGVQWVPGHTCSMGCGAAGKICDP